MWTGRDWRFGRANGALRDRPGKIVDTLAQSFVKLLKFDDFVYNAASFLLEHVHNQLHLRRRGLVFRPTSQDGRMRRRQMPDLVERKSELLHPTNEGDALEIGELISSVARHRSLRRRQELHALVVSDGLYADARTMCQFTDSQGSPP